MSSSTRRARWPMTAAVTGVLLLASVAGATSAPETESWFFVGFSGRITDPVRDDVASTGLRIDGLVAPDTYIAWGSRRAAARAAGLEGIRAVRAMPAGRKLATSLRGAKGSTLAVEVTVASERAGAAAAFLGTVGQVGGRLSDGELVTRISTRVPRAALSAIASRPEVRHVAPAPGAPVALDEASDQVMAGNVDAAGQGTPGYRSWLEKHGIDGTGIRVAVVDTGIDETHPDLSGRVAERFDYTTVTSADQKAHGTHVAGIVGGNPVLAVQPADPQGRLYGLGMAPGIELVDQQYLGTKIGFEPFDPRTLARDAWAAGARVSNNSWTRAEDVRPGYDAYARTFDIAARDADPERPGAEDFLFVFAAGNNPTMTGSPQEAKNIIVVGATSSGRNLFPMADGDTEAETGFSTRGPAVDGRIFPTLVAPGDYVVSARAAGANDPCVPPPDGGGLYVSCSGTSMASPHVAGAAALVQQWWKREHGGLPSPAMVKALLVSSARDLAHRDIPNTFEGWGRVDLGALFAEPPGQTVDQGRVLGAPGEQATYEVEVGEDAGPLKVTLAWSDAPGAPEAEKALVNDLDLVVEQLDARGAVARAWRGNVFARGASVTGGQSDRRNNLENVFVDAPAPGSYRIRVRAHDLPGDGVPGASDETDQDFALVVRGTRPGSGQGEADDSSVGVDSLVRQGSRLRVEGGLALGPSATAPAVVAADPEGDVLTSGAGVDIGTSTITTDFAARTLTFRMGIADPAEAGEDTPLTSLAWGIQVDGNDEKGFWLGAGRAGTHWPARTEPWTELCTHEVGPACGDPLVGSVEPDEIRWVLPFDGVSPAIRPGSLVGPGGAWSAPQGGVVWAGGTYHGYPMDEATSFRGYVVPGGIDVAVAPAGTHPDPADFARAGVFDPATGRYTVEIDLPPAGNDRLWVRSCWGRATRPTCVLTSAPVPAP